MSEETRPVVEDNETPAATAEKQAPKPAWSTPVIVPLSVSLTEQTPGVGSDGGVFPDSTLP